MFLYGIRAVLACPKYCITAAHRDILTMAHMLLPASTEHPIATTPRMVLLACCASPVWLERPYGLKLRFHQGCSGIVGDPPELPKNHGGSCYKAPTRRTAKLSKEQYCSKRITPKPALFIYIYTHINPTPFKRSPKALLEDPQV